MAKKKKNGKKATKKAAPKKPQPKNEAGPKPKATGVEEVEELKTELPVETATMPFAKKKGDPEPHKPTNRELLVISLIGEIPKNIVSQWDGTRRRIVIAEAVHLLTGDPRPDGWRGDYENTPGWSAWEMRLGELLADHYRPKVKEPLAELAEKERKEQEAKEAAKKKEEESEEDKAASLENPSEGTEKKSKFGK